MRRLWCLAAIHLVSVLAPTPGSGQEPTYQFEDQAVEQPDLLQWRTRLLAAIARRDTVALLGALHPRILNSFGGDGGIEEFRQQWNLRRNPDKSEIWPLLASILRGGGRFTPDGIFVAPAYSSAPVTPPLPPDWDGFETLMVVGQNVRVRAQPSLDAPILATLSRAVVGRDRSRTDQTDATGQAWTPIHLIHANQPGWIAQELLRSPIDYRIGISRLDTTWVIRTLVAGD